MKTKKFRIEITDFREAAEDITNTLKGFTSKISAKRSACIIVQTLAKDHNLGWENQGDQYMAFYPHGHELGGLGAITVQVLDEATGKPINHDI